MPPTTNPEFASWAVAKDDRGKVAGMVCPACQAKAAAAEGEAAEGEPA